MERKQREFKRETEEEEKEEKEEDQQEEKQEEEKEEKEETVQERYQELLELEMMTDGEEEEEDDEQVLEIEMTPQQWWESDEAFMARRNAFLNGIFYDDAMEYLHSILHKKNP